MNFGNSDNFPIFQILKVLSVLNLISISTKHLRIKDSKFPIIQKFKILL